MLDFSENYICPYCGSMDYLQKFLIKTKDGYNGKVCLCPYCKKRMKFKLLTARFEPSEWGEWLYLNIRLFNSPKYRFYDDIQWKTLWNSVNLMPRYVKHQLLEGFYRWKQNFDKIKAEKRLDEINEKYGIYRKVKTRDEIQMARIESFFEGFKKPNQVDFTVPRQRRVDER